MPLSNFPKGFSNGVSIQGLPIAMVFATSQAALGNSAKTGIWWVDSNNGLDGNEGTYQKPLATIGRAFVLAGANDVIVLKPNHAESVSSATAASGAWNVAGISVVGLGVNGQRPTITLDTANTSTINVSAANIQVQNVAFVANFLNVAVMFTVTAKGFTCTDCDMVDTDSTHNFLALSSTSATLNACDKLSFVGNRITQLAATGAQRLVTQAGTNDRLYFDSNVISQLTTGTGAQIVQATTKINTNLWFGNNVLSLVNAAATTTGLIATTDQTTNTGFIYNNSIHCLATSPILATATSGYTYDRNLEANTNDLQGYLVPAADS